MSGPAAPVVVSPGVVARRLGRYAIGASRDVRAVEELAAGETLMAAVIVVWRRRGWVVVATDVGLRLARRPRLLGRAQDHAFAWRDLTAVSSGPNRVAMSFGDDEVSLLVAGPDAEFARLMETVRDHAGSEKPSVDEIRALARKKLGRMAAYGFQASIEGLPDRLEPAERVERLATATLGFTGLLVLTDRRLLLLDVTLRRGSERIWDVPRGSIRAAEPLEDGLRLLLDGADDVTLVRFVPPERRDEFAAVLRARPA